MAVSNGMRDIPQRELRNDITRVLREVEGGTRFRITVAGRPVAELIPAAGQRTWVPRKALHRIISAAPLDKRFFSDVDSAVDEEVDWP